MTLNEFESKLKGLLVDPYSLSFVCDGSPLKCSLFIVGTKWARRVEKPFLRFWEPTYGFRKQDFLRELYQLPGGPTRTRKIIEIIAAAVGQQVTLDTNIYLHPAPGSKHSTPRDKKTGVFEWLLYTIKPRVVFAYGKPAKEFFRERGGTITENSLTPQAISLDGLEFELLSWTHLTYQTSYADVEEIGRALAEALRSTARKR